MTDAPHLTRAKQIEQAAREERLAQALRDNLRRRKLQSRARLPTGTLDNSGCEKVEGEGGEPLA